MARLTTRVALIVGGYFLAGCAPSTDVEAPSDPCQRSGLPLARMIEHFESPERMIYPTVAELIAESLSALSYEPAPAESAGPGLAYVKGKASRVEFAQTLPSAERPAPSYERWLGDLRISAYSEGELEPRLHTLFECTCNAARDVGRQDLACGAEPEGSVRVAAEQCRAQASEREDSGGASDADEAELLAEEQRCIQGFWIERGKVASRR